MADISLVSSPAGAGSVRSSIMAALSYLGILCFIPLIMNKDDEFVLFHSKQGVILWGWSVFALLSMELPGIGKWFFSISSMAILIFSIIGLISVAFRRAWKLPLVSDLAQSL